MRRCARVVGEMGSKSTGLCPRGFESRRRRLVARCAVVASAVAAASAAHSFFDSDIQEAHLALMGKAVGLIIRRLRARVPQGVCLASPRRVTRSLRELSVASRAGKAPTSKGGDCGFEPRLDYSGAAERDRRDRLGDPQGKRISSPSPSPLCRAVSSVARGLSRHIRFAGAPFSM
jgi:hypothetical protein